MGIRIFCVRVVNIIRRHQLDAGFCREAHQLLIDHPLLRDAVILQFQEEIAFSENLLIPQCGLFSHLVLVPHHRTRHLTCKAGGKRDNALVILFQNLHVDTRLIVKSIDKARRNNLHQIGIARIIFRQQNQMVVPVLSAAGFAVETGTRRHVNLTAEDRLDALRAGFFIKIDTAEHDAVIGDRGAVHAKFFDSGDVLFDLVRAVQKAVFGMYM